MFKRFFGQTDADQMEYLRKKVIITIISVLLCFVGFSPLFAIVMLFVWGWGVIKTLFDVVSVGMIFSGNIFIGSAIFLLYIIIAYFAGIVFSLIGTGRYVYLLVKYWHKEK